MKFKQLLLLSFVSFYGDAKDITQLVINNTDYDEQVQALCLASCGNKGWSRLDHVSIVPAGQGHFSLTIKGSAAFHQVNGRVTFMGKQVTPKIDLKYPIAASVFGTLDSKTCLLKVDHIRIDGDKLGLTKGAKNEIGKSHKIEKCQRFIEMRNQ